MTPTFLTPREVAARWGCSARHVRRLCAAGELRAMRLGLESWRISLETVEAYEHAHTSGAASSTSDEGRKAEAVRPVFGVLPEATGPLVLPERWWEGEAASPRTRTTKKAASQRH
jgi:excisionase family DNA binding protein